MLFMWTSHRYLLSMAGNHHQACIGSWNKHKGNVFFKNPDTQTSVFDWGHQCSWTLTLAISIQISIIQFSIKKGSNQAQGNLLWICIRVIWSNPSLLSYRNTAGFELGSSEQLFDTSAELLRCTLLSLSQFGCQTFSVIIWLNYFFLNLIINSKENFPNHIINLPN